MTTKAEYEALLDNYRGRCDGCGREPVLLEFIGTYDGLETRCLLDRAECDRLAGERRTAEAVAFQARLAAGDPQAKMQKALFDAMGGLLLERMKRRPVFADLSKPRTMEWRKYGTLPRDQEVPVLPGAEDDAL